MTGKEVLKFSSPVIAMGTVWIAQKAMSFAYGQITGESIPAADDLDVPIVRVIAYASAAAVLGAVITVSVNRTVAQAILPAPELT